MYLVFDIGGTAIKYCWMNEAGEIFNKQEILFSSEIDIQESKCIFAF